MLGLLDRVLTQTPALDLERSLVVDGPTSVREIDAPAAPPGARPSRSLRARPW